MEKEKDSTEYLCDTLNPITPFVFNLGDRCVAIKLGWGGIGTPQSPLHRINVKGEITSIKGLEGHNNVHKYEFTWKGGRFYTDNKWNELIPFKNRR